MHPHPSLRLVAAKPRALRPRTRHAVRVAALGLILATLAAVSARAEAPPGGLMLRPILGEDGAAAPPVDPARPAPAVGTEIDIRVTGPIARARVRQMFVNPDDAWVEGTYVFPLPEDSAVDSLRMRIGERTIEGMIKEKQAARRDYEAARRDGRRASLVTQERPNVFTTAVTNIAPKSSIAVEIGFQETLRRDDGRFVMRFPTVVAPRYIPGDKTILGEAGSGWGINTPQVPDAERITPPVRHPESAARNPVSFTVRLDAGLPLARLASPSHAIEVRDAADGGKVVTLKDGAVPADRDFVLTWTPRPAADPGLALFTETAPDGATYLLAMIQPPAAEAAKANALPREVVFVVDTSGSMDGLSMDGARAALLRALDGLGPDDRFNIVRFSNDASVLFPTARTADPRSLAEARRFVANLSASGGTEILSALALALDGRFDAARVRQIVLLTDGAVGNEAEVLGAVRRGLGDSRLFTVGIGSAPNSYLMRKAAELGHGTYTFIADESRVESRMGRLFAKLEAPVLGDLRATFSESARAEMWPARLPDLYAGEPLVFAARLEDVSGGIGLGGWRNGVDWSLTLPLSAARPGTGIAKLWARGRIESLTDRRHEGASEDDIRRDVLGVALEHGLVSDFTSLVAVDVTPARPAGEGLDSRPVATDLPHGWTFEKVFGGPPAPAAPDPTRQARVVATAVGQPLLRARGATASDLGLAVGFLALLGGGALLILSRRRRVAP